MVKKFLVTLALVFCGNSALAEMLTTKTVHVNTVGLTVEQFIKNPLPEDNCTTWVKLKTGEEKVPEVTIVHVARWSHYNAPYILVTSSYKDRLAFHRVVRKIQDWWRADSVGSINDRGDDISAVISFSKKYAAIDDRRRSVLVDSGGWVDANPIDIFKAQFTLVLNQFYSNDATYEQHCMDIPKWIVDSYPHQHKIKK